jgi:hypothetical protein
MFISFYKNLGIRAILVPDIFNHFKVISFSITCGTFYNEVLEISSILKLVKLLNESGRSFISVPNSYSLVNFVLFNPNQSGIYEILVYFRDNSASDASR